MKNSSMLLIAATLFMILLDHGLLAQMPQPPAAKTNAVLTTPQPSSPKATTTPVPPQAPAPKAATTSAPEDLGWSQWRGPTRDNVAPSQQWSWKWPKDGPKKLWTANVGRGYANLIVSKGRVFAFGEYTGKNYAGRVNYPCVPREEKYETGDNVTCLDAETGKLIWRTKVGDGNSLGRGKKLCETDAGCTPCTDGKYVYVVVADGKVVALDFNTGRVVWEVKDLVKTYNLEIEFEHGFLNSPLLVKDVLVLSQGLGFDKNTGKFLWQNKEGWKLNPPSQDHYHSPVWCPSGNSPGVLLIGESLVRVDPFTGKTLWREDQVKKKLRMVYADPIVLGDRIFHPGYRFKFTDSSVTLDNDGLNPRAEIGYLSNPVIWKGHLYATKNWGEDSGILGEVPGLFESYLQCFDLANNLKCAWITNGYAGTPIVCDGKLIIQGPFGDVRVVEASPAGYKLLANARISDYRNPNAKDDNSFGPGGWAAASYQYAVVVNGRLYCRFVHGDTYCLDVRNDYPNADTAVESRLVVGELATVTGVLHKKPDNEGKSVLGVLTEASSSTGKAGEAKTFTLCATRSGKFRDLPKIAAWVNKGATVKVAGTLLFDDRIAVNSVEEAMVSGKTR